MHGRREPIECLIDSGAGPSVVSEALMDRLGIQGYPLANSEKKKCDLYSATGHSLNIVGKSVVIHKYANGP